MEHMTRRSFVKLSAAAGGVVALGGLAACTSGASVAASPVSFQGAESASSSGGESVSASSSSSSTEVVASSSDTLSAVAATAPAVYFARAVDPTAMRAVFEALGRGLSGERIGVKLSSGEPGGNHFLQPSLIEGLVKDVNGTIVECNTAYGGGRSSTDAHYQVAADHGFTGIADFQIMDEDGSVGLPVKGGFHLSENLVGAHFPEYDGFLVLSHFKGHAMAGFGGALKNISIGMASSAGKCRIHTGGESDTSWMGGDQAAFQEAMADACRAVLDAVGGNMLFVNVMNNLSVDCDCDPNPAPPKMADIGILASVDPVALDQACVDLVYASNDDSADLIERIESRDGQHILEAAEALGVGSRAYELVEVEG